MNAINALLQSPEALNVIAGIVTALWALFRGTEWYRSIQASRAATLMGHVEDAVEGAVVATYHDYVEGIKRGGILEPPRLTAEQAHNARVAARSSAIHNAHALGIDLIKILGEDGIALAIEAAVKRQKGLAQ